MVQESLKEVQELLTKEGAWIAVSFTFRSGAGASRCAIRKRSWIASGNRCGGSRRGRPVSVRCSRPF